MAVYQYRCTDHGVLEVGRPIGTAAEREPCPACGVPATRVFTAPRLALGDAGARALIERAERSASEPDVVSAPPSRRPAPAVNPAHARLPRP
ncbi:FmdB family zinc ribbon protein [Geodermatophilus sp. SYSU D00758]